MLKFLKYIQKDVAIQQHNERKHFTDQSMMTHKVVYFVLLLSFQKDTSIATSTISLGLKWISLILSVLHVHLYTGPTKNVLLLVTFSFVDTNLKHF